MKKTIIALIALSGMAVAEDASVSSVTLHDVTFTAPSAVALHNAFADADAAKAADIYLTGSSYYTNKSMGLVYNGLYIANDAGMKFNHSENVTVNHLYIGSDIKMRDSTNNVIGAINWSDTNAPKLKIGSGSGTWVDINADYGTVIDLSAMTSGAVYLNTAGALTLSTALNSNVTVYATISDTLSMRTLLQADFSDWGGNVILQNADGTTYNGGAYIWEATATGLNIMSIPEPTTATLSLFALISLAARRRRK